MAPLSGSARACARARADNIRSATAGGGWISSLEHCLAGSPKWGDGGWLCGGSATPHCVFLQFPPCIHSDARITAI